MKNEFDNVIWNDLKIKLKHKYTQLTNADLLHRQGSQDELLRNIAFKLGKTKKELQSVIDRF